MARSRSPRVRRMPRSRATLFSGASACPGSFGGPHRRPGRAPQGHAGWRPRRQRAGWRLSRCCLALGATVHTTRREVAAAKFFVGHCQTVLKPGEIITSATFPVARQAAYVKFLNPAARYALVGVFAARAADGSPRVAVTGARADGAFRWREAETALTEPSSPRGYEASLSRPMVYRRTCSQTPRTGGTLRRCWPAGQSP